MNHEDPILQKDGTILTSIDVAILKFGKKIADFFRREDDETYTPALRLFLGLVTACFFGNAIVFGYLGGPAASLQPLILGCLTLWLSLSPWLRCTNTGTVREPQTNKAGALCALISPSILWFPLLIAAVTGQVEAAGALALGLPCLSVHLMVLAIGYIRRLGAAPPKRQRAHATKPVFAP